MSDVLSRHCQCEHCRSAAMHGDWSNVERSSARGHRGLGWVKRRERIEMMGATVEEGPYEETPCWHPMRWFGWKVRRWINAEPWDGSWWEYARPKKAARQVLEERFGG